MNFISKFYYRKRIQYLRYYGKDDVKFSKLQYYLKTGKELDLAHPHEFTEKLQWLKLHKYGEEYGDLVDKYEVRHYVKQKIGEEYLNTLYGVYEDPEEIDFDELPDKFALKGTHGSGYNVLVEDKSRLNIRKTQKRLCRILDKNYYLRCRERVYKNVKPRIVAERFLSIPDSRRLLDYKILCFNGKPECIYVGHCGKVLGYFDTDWHKLDDENYVSEDIPRPKKLKKMLQLARKLSENFLYMRVDFYIWNQQIIFGELTFFNFGGLRRFPIEHLNLKLGKLIQLPEEELKKTRP